MVTAQTHAFPPIDPGRNQIILAVGRKGSGKSESARTFFRNWPTIDRLVLDINGDVELGDDIPVTPLTAPLPDRLPARKSGEEGRPQTFRWIANPSAETFRDDADRVIGLGLYPKDRDMLVWVDEAGVVFPVNAVGPHGRTALHQSRHFRLSLLLCCPRPIAIDPLCVSQADRVLIYDLPNPKDRQRIADNIGWPPAKLDEELEETRRRGPHWFTMYVAAEHALFRCPPLPR